MCRYASAAELLSAAQSLAGQSLCSLSKILGVSLPSNPAAAKGFVGTLVEKALGVDAPTAPIPDFAYLNIELKTLPLDGRQRVTESTYICRCHDGFEASWEVSRVYGKTRHILWMPIETAPIAFAERRLGLAQLWQPSEAHDRVLRQDWEELTHAWHMGQIEACGAEQGTFLQLRPKAANSQTVRSIVDAQGQPCGVVPKGFYFRSRFTKELVRSLWG